MKKTGAILSAVAMLMVSVVALTVASFAWFTTSSKADVKDLNMTVQGGSNLLVSASYAGEYKSELAFTGDNKMKAVTPQLEADKKIAIKDGADGAKLFQFDKLANLEELLADTAEPKTTTPSYTEVTKAEDSWVQKDIYLKADRIPAGQKLEVGLNFNGATVFTAAASEPEGGNAAVIAAQKKAIDALRVAFLVQKMDEATSKPAADPAAKAIVYQPVADATPAPTDSSYHDDDRLCVVDATALASGTLPLFEADTQGDVYQVSLYLWIEGNDIDCVDSILGGKITALFGFIGKAVDVA